jgi:hypothetical protein
MSETYAKTSSGEAFRCKSCWKKAQARVDASKIGNNRGYASRKSLTVAGALVALAAVFLGGGARASADPTGEYSPDVDLIKPLPVITPTPSNWSPKFPFPYDQTKGSVTDADITAEREMCQWFNAQYETLRRQIDSLQFDRITPDGPGVISGTGSDWDYSINGIQQEADVVTTNIDQAVNFLAPRAQALTQTTDYVGDVYFPLYEGESFYRLWQHLSNVSDGIKSHQPDWFTGPSVLRVKRWGTQISRSHVCD